MEYSWLYVTGSTTVTASGGFAAQTTALNNGLTDPAHTFSSSGFTVPAGTYLVGMLVSWNVADSLIRYPYVYDSTNGIKYMHAYDDQSYVSVSPMSGFRQNYVIPINLTGSTLLSPGFHVSSTASRVLAAGNLTRMIVVKVAS